MLLGNAQVFVRKWIGECFTGVLSLSTLLFVWDQCFMLGCAHDVISSL